MPLTDNQKRDVDSAEGNRERLALLAGYALQELGSTDSNTAKTGKEIIAKIKELYSLDIAEGTFPVYLSGAPALNRLVVSCGTGKGYYYDAKHQAQELGVQAPSDEQIEAEPQERQRREKESKLYIHVLNWLIANGYRAKVLAQGRSLGPWGNPDVVGIQVVDILGSWQAQTVSIEVKFNGDNWKKDIFQAVSHRRFFDRCYFCYPVLANNRQIPEELKDYAELYSIGILLVELAPIELEKLINGKDLDPNNLSITEVCPAPYSPVLPKYRKSAFAALEIANLQHLYEWAVR